MYSSRYVLFAFEEANDDRNGGADDLIGIFGSIEEAKKHFNHYCKPHGWVGHITDNDLNIILRYERFPLVPVPVYHKPSHWEYRWSDEE